MEQLLISVDRVQMTHFMTPGFLVLLWLNVLAALWVPPHLDL